MQAGTDAVGWSRESESAGWRAFGAPAGVWGVLGIPTLLTFAWQACVWPVDSGWHAFGVSIAFD